MLVYRLRKDFFSAMPPSRNAVDWWLVFAGFALPGFLLSSAALQSNNDLGRHAGMCMRFVLLLWATPLVLDYLDTRRAGRTVPGAGPLLRLGTRLGVATLFLGLAGQLWQIVILRTYVPLVDAGAIAGYPVPLRFPHIAGRFYDLREAMQALNQRTSATAIVQSNPAGRLQAVVELYGRRQMAAGDPGCETPFGGNPSLCPAAALESLFGGPGRSYQGEPSDVPRLGLQPDKVTVEAFTAACREQSLSAMIAVYSDPAWQDPQSWVWQLKPIFANRTARVYLCPAG